MRRITKNIQVLLSFAAALFIALSPLIHGLHLVLVSHSHNHCNVCIHKTSTHSHGKSHNWHVCVIRTRSSSNEDGHKRHDPNTCPLCRKLAELLKDQIVLQNPVTTVLHDMPPEEQVYLPWHFCRISFNNIIPRAPPAC